MQREQKVSFLVPISNYFYAGLITSQHGYKTKTQSFYILSKCKRIKGENFEEKLTRSSKMEDVKLEEVRKFSKGILKRASKMEEVLKKFWQSLDRFIKIMMKNSFGNRHL